jgi:hypothetical protein
LGECCRKCRFGLRSLADKRAIEPFISLLEKPVLNVNLCVPLIYGLQNFGDERAIPVLEHFRDFDERMAMGYGKLKDLAGVAAATIKLRALPTIDEVLKAYRKGDIYTCLATVSILEKGVIGQGVERQLAMTRCTITSTYPNWLFYQKTYPNR